MALVWHELFLHNQDLFLSFLSLGPCDLSSGLYPWSDFAFSSGPCLLGPCRGRDHDPLVVSQPSQLHHQLLQLQDPWLALCCAFVSYLEIDCNKIFFMNFGLLHFDRLCFEQCVTWMHIRYLTWGIYHNCLYTIGIKIRPIKKTWIPSTIFRKMY